jgi:hypothetical protein
MTFSFLKSRTAIVAVSISVAAAAFFLRSQWMPIVESFSGTEDSKNDPDHAHADEHDAHSAGHSDHESLELSDQAMRNLGLTPEFLQPISTSTYFKTISVPALIVERPGRTVIQVATPMTGVVTRVSAVQGAAVEPGDNLFQIRLTHEELVTSQTDFVRALGELDVETRELKRLQAGVDSGVIPPRSVLERQYAKEKLEALLGAQREALRLHGLSERQVQQIEQERRLLSELSVTAPSHEQQPSELQLSDKTIYQPVAINRQPLVNTATEGNDQIPLIIESLDVQRGQSIEQGGRLCSLADYSQLYIEGRAFEQDTDAIGRAAGRDWKVQAVFSDGQIIESLPIAFVSSEIDEEARTLKFYVGLQNEIVRDNKDAEGRRFVSWKYKPGQRLQLQIPMDEWKDQIVVPVDAVAQEGAEYFVFQKNGRHFDRMPVHVLHRDQQSVVIANDGSIFPGDVIALRNAHQMQMAIRNKAGGGIDPHAGHNH